MPEVEKMSPLDNKEHVYTLTAVSAAAAPLTSLNSNYSTVVRYKECRKNHAAAIGGNATDGCGEFMPSGEEGSQEALKCSACHCHRNFHRKEVEGDGTLCSLKSPADLDEYQKRSLNKMLINHNTTNGSTNPLECKQKYDEVEDKMTLFTLARPEGNGKHEKPIKKRSRTKFTQDQKQKMLTFAEDAGWKIQKLEQSQIQQFCQEIGIQRRVLKVWMHNNKNIFAKKRST